MRESHCIKCSLKANEGYLYPLAKSFVFVHKPTVIIKFDDVEFVRFERYHPSANSATKNFDIVVAVKSSAMNLMGDNGGSKEYAFLGIERIEFHNLHDFFVTKKMVIKGVDANSQSAMYNIDKELGLSDDEGKPKQSLQLDEIDSEEEDDDYDGGSDGVNSASDDDSGSDSGDEGTTPVVTKKTKSKATLSSPSKKKPREGGSDSESDEEEAKGSKKGSKKKDKNAPKGATTSYMFYVAANRATLKSEHPDLSFGELAKLLGEKWKTLSSEEKQPYEEQALQDKERYKNDMNNYVPPSGKDDDKKKKRKVDPNAPKGASSAYILFGSDARADIKEAHPEFSMIEVTKEIGARWKAISEADKAVYENMAKEDKKRYDMQMAQYKETGEFTAVEKPSSGLVSSSQSSTIKPDPEGVQEQTDNSAEDGSAAPVKTEVKTEPETASEVVKMEQE